ncbi:hypothetical protein SAMN04489737_0207 [Arcanobacterium phocae]|uniref:Cna protein B-type domain-containing protein n=1 Tax=Arcanobacterium phocae TaxID=131112 RepID=A0A1H2LBR0_9ACTO|nr:CshA/CshB family fibrillar adhesin-related protein [Arcanobacterium phocae]SDU77866.1 hypothetical protein SAMN04489737_0207 [Arcanobacterium phocae]
MRRRKKIAVLSTITGLFLALFVVLPVTNTPANAQYGDGGSDKRYGSKYAGVIDWIDWSKRYEDTDDEKIIVSDLGDPKPWKDKSSPLYGKGGGAGGDYSAWIYGTELHKPYVVKSYNAIGAATLITTCRMSDFHPDKNVSAEVLDNKKTWLAFETPGRRGWANHWDKVYQSYDPNKEKGMPVGIGLAGNASRDVSFDLDCSANIKSVNNGVVSISPVPIKGLVISDPETLTKNETINIVPVKAQDDSIVRWKMLEGNDFGKDLSGQVVVGTPDNAFGNDYPATTVKSLTHFNSKKLDFGKSLRWTVRDNDQPFETLYAEDATGMHVYIHRPGGGNAVYIALGVVVGVDFSDGKEIDGKVYDQAGAVVQPDIIGRPLEGGTNRQPIELNAKSNSLGSKYLYETSLNYQVTPYLGEKGPDLDTHYVNGGRGWSNLIGDDQTGDDDEDAFDRPLLVAAQPGTVTQDIPCMPAEQGETHVSGWLDWNADGHLDDKTERANGTCSGKTATLTWDVTEDMVKGLTSTPSKSLLRLVITTAGTDTYSYDSIVPDGEVEDHPVTLVRPRLSITKKMVDDSGATIGSDSLAGFVFKTVYDSALLTITDPEKQTDTSGVVNWPLAFKDLETRSLDIRDAQPQEEATLTVAEVNSGELGYAPYSVDCHSNITGDGSENGQLVYAWPEAESLEPRVKADDKAFSLTIKPTTIGSCTVKNQKYAQISVTPQVSFLNLPQQLGATDQLFKGSFTCTPPTHQGTSFPQLTEVTGEWEASLGQPWTSDPKEHYIVPGSTCSVTSVVPSDPQIGPIANNSEYVWSKKASGDYEYSATKVNKATQSVQNIDVSIHAKQVETASVYWKNLNRAEKEISPATFKLSSESAGFNVEDIIDCTQEPCQGMDKDSRPGHYRVDDVKLGDNYVLTQIVAPTGYELAAPTKPFNVVAKDIGHGKEIGPVYNDRISANLLPSLPLSGGMSAVLFTLIGACGMLLASATGYSTLRTKWMEKGDN